MSSTPQVIAFKRGDTVMLGCTATDHAGQPVDLTLVSVEAQVRPQKESDPIVAQLELVWVDRTAGRFELWAPDSGLAEGWPVGNLRVDVQYTEAVSGRTIRRSSETFFLFIEPDVTA